MSKLFINLVTFQVIASSLQLFFFLFPLCSYSCELSSIERVEGRLIENCAHPQNLSSRLLIKTAKATTSDEGAVAELRHNSTGFKISFQSKTKKFKICSFQRETTTQDVTLWSSRTFGEIKKSSHVDSMNMNVYFERKGEKWKSSELRV